MAGQEIEAGIKRLEDYRDICNMQGRYNHCMLSGRFERSSKSGEFLPLPFEPE